MQSPRETLFKLVLMLAAPQRRGEEDAQREARHAMLMQVLDRIAEGRLPELNTSTALH